MPLKRESLYDIRRVFKRYQHKRQKQNSHEGAKSNFVKNSYPNAETLLNSGNIVLSSHKRETELLHHIATLIK